MTIADKLTLLANTKEALRAKLKLAKSVPFSKYPEYVNWNTAPSIPNKAFYADFTNDRYVKDGVPCNFKDLFTFNRAGKAWLVKDTGLQEYAADVPRLDNGLLIEHSATNIALNSNLSSAGYYSLNGVATYQDGKILFPTSTVPSSAYQMVSIIPDVIYTGRVWFDRKVITYPNPNFETQVLVNSSHPELLESDNYSYWGLQSHNNTIGNFGVRRSYLDTDFNSSFSFKRMQVEQSSYPSSFISTATTPVTRPADFLTNKITGTTVTGDWDSTLTLSIVAGNLVHSGYGRIRSLEIN